MRGRSRLTRRLAFCAAFILVGPTRLLGYGGDTHYYLRFASALEACFNWDEAHLIASADYMLDKNRATTAEKQPVQRYNKIHWHAFGRSEERFNGLWQRVEQEADAELQLVKLGQFLHFASDWESHYGFGVRMGHGLQTIFGFDPDSLANDAMNNSRMVGQTLMHMVKVCVLQGRMSGDPNRYIAELAENLEEEPLVQELYEFNSRKWKRFGRRGRKGKAILRKNHLLIEQLIERRGREHPERNIPSDFTPGDPERGLPPPLGIRYDGNADVVAVYGAEIELYPEYDGSRMSALEEERFEASMETGLVDDLRADAQQEEELDLFSRLELEIHDVDVVPQGWRIKTAVENLGPGRAPAGSLDLFVVHVASEEVLGQISEPVPELAGRERIKIELLVPSEVKPGKDILVGAALQTDDLSSESHNTWFTPWKSRLRGEFGKRKRKQPREPGAASLLGTPKVWIDAEGGFWLAIDALVTGGDSSRRLGDVHLRIVGEDGKTVYAVQFAQPVWNSAADLRRGIVPARSFHTPPSRLEFCDAVTSHEQDTNLQLEVSIVGGNTLPFGGTYPVRATALAQVRSLCSG